MRLQCGRFTKNWKMLLLVFLAVMNLHTEFRLNFEDFFTTGSSFHKNLTSAHSCPASEIPSQLQQQIFVFLQLNPSKWTQSPLHNIVIE